MEADFSTPYAWSSDVVLPQIIQTQVTQLLGLAADCHKGGIDMQQVFIGLTADGHRHLMDCSEVPYPVVSSWIMMNAEKNNMIVLVACYEGWTVPSHVSAQWEKDGRPDIAISDHPESYETLVITVETLNGTWVGHSKIIGEHPNRTIEPLVLKKIDGASGPLNNLLRANWSQDRMGTLQKATTALQHLKANMPESAE